MDGVEEIRTFGDEFLTYVRTNSDDIHIPDDIIGYIERVRPLHVGAKFKMWGPKPALKRWQIEKNHEPESIFPDELFEID